MPWFSFLSPETWCVALICLVIPFAYYMLTAPPSGESDVVREERERRNKALEKTRYLTARYPTYVEQLQKTNENTNKPEGLSGRDQLYYTHLNFAGAASERLQSVLLYFLNDKNLSEEVRFRRIQEVLRILDSCWRNRGEKRTRAVQEEALMNLRVFMEAVKPEYNYDRELAS